MFRLLGGLGQSDCVQTSVRRCWAMTACTHQVQHGVIKCAKINHIFTLICTVHSVICVYLKRVGEVIYFFEFFRQPLGHLQKLWIF